MAHADVQPDHRLTSAVAGLLSRCAFPPAGTPIRCAVSGGADSLALLALACATGAPVTAIHVDHGLRPGSDVEATVVSDAARRLGATFRAERVVVAPGANLEARARAARYAVLPVDVCTGHTADDQAETVLLNVLRGSGVPGIAAMRSGPRHPILAIRRHETRALCDQLGLTPVVDPMNDDDRFRRVRVRHELVPLLDDIADRDIVPLLCRQSDLAADIADVLAHLARSIDPTDAKAVATAPVAVARWVVRTWVRRTTGSEHPIDAASVERALRVAGGEIRATEIDGWRLARTAGRLRLEPVAPRRPSPTGRDGADASPGS